jgi:hypothetical protein
MRHRLALAFSRPRRWLAGSRRRFRLFLAGARPRRPRDASTTSAPTLPRCSAPCRAW